MLFIRKFFVLNYMASCLLPFLQYIEFLICVRRYGYSKERFVWSLISAVGIFCLGSGATVVHGFQNLWAAQVYRFLSCNLFIGK